MKKTTARILAMIAMAATSVFAHAATQYGLFVGINEYSLGAKYLDGCDWDAMRMLDAWTTGGSALQANCGLVASTAATKETLRERLRALAATAVSGDTVLYYHSSHGGDYESVGDDAGSFLCATDEEWYDYEFAEDLEGFAPGVKVIVVIDACFSGGLFKSASRSPGGFAFASRVNQILAKRRSQKKGGAKTYAEIAWITASDSDETSSMDGRGSEFTHRFLEGWEDASADADGDGSVTFGELADYAMPRVENSTVQTQNSSLLNAVVAGHAFDVTTYRTLSFDKRFYGFFGECPATITLPRGTVEIADSAFDVDYNSSVVNLTSVTILTTVRKIGLYAFYGCENLATVNLRADRSLVAFGDYAFYGTPAYDTLFPVPENDDFANPETIEGESGSVRGTTMSATTEDIAADGDLLSNYMRYYYGDEYYVSRTVWYAWTAPKDGVVSMTASSVNGISRYFVVGKTTGISDGNGTWMNRSNATGSLAFIVESGVTYYISVGSWDISAATPYMPGDFELSWTMPDPPANDDFANALSLGRGRTGSFSGTTVGATADDDDFLLNYDGTDATVWYKWMAPRDGIMMITNTLDDSEFLIGVTTGLVTYVEDDDEWQEWNYTAIEWVYRYDNGDDANMLAFKCKKGVWYYIAVGQYMSDSGEFAFAWDVIDPPANDNFADAITLSGAEGSTTGSNFGATREAFEDEIEIDLGAYTVWWKWTAPATDVYEFDTFGSRFDTMISVLTEYEDGEGDSYYDIVAENDDARSNNYNESYAYFEAEEGKTYWIGVSGYETETGNIVLNWRKAVFVPIVSNGSLTGYRGPLPSELDLTGTGITAINSYVFRYSSLVSITLPETLATIGYQAFCNCQALESIAIPASVTNIGNEAFAYCSSLADVAFEGEDGADGISMDIESAFMQTPWLLGPFEMTVDENGVLVVSGAVPSEVVIPDGTLSIPESAFYNATRLTSVTIPNGVRYIGYNAFGNCSNLRSVNIPASVVEIGSYAFRYCYSLSSVTFGAKEPVADEGYVYFDSTLGIGGQAFYGCPVASLDFPAHLAYVDYDAFSWNGSLAEVTFRADPQVTESYMEIGSNAFCGCNNLQSVVFEDRLYDGYNGYWNETYIYGNAFSGCSSLTNLTLGTGIAAIYSYVFNACTSLQTVRLPASLQEFSSYSFNGCTSLTAFEFDDAARGYAAFDGILYEAWVETDEEYDDDDNFLGIVTNAVYKYVLRCPEGKTGDVVLPSDLTGFYDDAFLNCANLSSVSIPETLEGVVDEESVFAGCSDSLSISYYPVPHTALTLEYGYGDLEPLVKKVALDAMNVGDMPYPARAGYAFGGWWTEPDGNGWQVYSSTPVSDLDGISTLYARWNEITYNWSYSFNSQGGITLTGITAMVNGRSVSPSGHVEIPDFIDGYLVTALGSNLISYDSMVTSVRLPAGLNPDSVSASYVFRNLSGLETVYLPDTLSGYEDTLRNYWFYGSPSTVSFEYYTPQYFTITLVPGEGATIDSTEVNTLGTVGDLPIPTREDYDFMGWWTAPEDGEWLAPETTIDSDIIAYARWQESIYNWSIQDYYENGVVVGTMLQGYSEYWWGVAVTRKDGETVSGKIEIPYGLNGKKVMAIGNYAFDGLSEITEVVVPPTVRHIYECGFSWCRSLTNISIPASCVDIARDAFHGCSNLESFQVAEGNPEFMDMDGVIYTRNGEELVAWPSGRGGVASVIDGTRRIGNMSFYDSSISSVVIPSSVEGISSYAFYSCDNLTSVDIPASVTYIYDYAFAYSGLLPDSVTIGNADAYIAPTAFRRTAYNDALPLTLVVQNGVVTGFIGGCPEHVDIGEEADELGVTITAIGSQAFCSWNYDVGNLRSIVIPEGVVSIGSYAFLGCSNLKDISLPSTLETLNYEAFYGTAVSSIDLPDGLRDIGNSAFERCHSLVNLDVPSAVTNIGNAAFRDCSSIRELTLPQSLVCIGAEAFSGCYNLQSIFIPSSVTEIGRRAFVSCYGLDLAYVPATLKGVIDDYEVFYGCDDSLEIRYYEGDEPVFATVALDWNDGSGFTEEFEAYQVLGDLPMPRKQGYSIEGWYLEQGCVNKVDAETVAVDGMTLYAKWVETIYEIAHYDENGDGTVTLICGYEERYDPMIGWDEYQVPCITPRPYGRYEMPSEIDGQTISSIGDSAFFGCYEMTEILIPAGVTSIAQSAFSACSALTNIIVDEENEYYSSRNGFLYDKLGETLIMCPPGRGDDVFVPDGTKQIGEYAFRYNKNILFVEFPDGLATIGYAAFQGCSTLEEVCFPYGLQYIGGYAFCGCESLNTAEFHDGLEGIGYYAFGECYSLEHVYFPYGLQRIADYAFYGCESLCAAELQEGLEEIGNHAFAYCHSIEDVYLPEGLLSIGEYAFVFCDSEWFTYIYIPSSVEYIYEYAFAWCTSLEDVTYADGTYVERSAFDRTPWAEENIEFTMDVNSNGNLHGWHGGCPSDLSIPSSVVYINNSLFYGCATLETLYVPANVTYIGVSAFANCPNLGEVLLPSTLVDLGYGMSWMRNNVFYGCPNVQISFYDVVTHIVTFDANGGEYNDDTERSVVDGMALGNVTHPTLGGYIFAGWHTAAEGGEMFSASSPVTEDMTLFAHWQESPFANFDEIWMYDEEQDIFSSGAYSWGRSTAELDVNGPARLSFDWTIESAGNHAYAYVYVDGDEYGYISSGTDWEEVSIVLADSEPHEVYFEFYFDGESNGSTDGMGLLLRNIAVSELEAYTVSLDVNGGSLDVDSMQVYDGAVNLPIPTRDGYDFMGWWTAPDGGEWIAPEGEVSGDFTAYAHWQESVYSWETQDYYDDYGNFIGLSITTGNWRPAVYDADGNAPTGVVEIPYAIDGQPVVAIGYCAFLYCNEVTEVVLPPTIVEIGDYAFSDCSSMESIELPSSLRSIGWNAFGTCRNLATITIPEGVTSIRGWAFGDCTGLSELHIPSTISYIEWGNVCARCTRLNAFSVDERNAYYTAIDGILYTKDGLTLFAWPAGRDGEARIPDGTKTIGAAAFSYSTVSSIALPDGVASINDDAFWECRNLTAVDIPASVTAIYSAAFAYSGLQPDGVTIGNPDAYVSSSAFSNTAWEAAQPIVLIIDNGTVTGFTGGCPNTLDIGEVAGGVAVTSIGRQAFYGSSHDMTPLRSVVVPEGVTNIGSQAFYYCRNLEDVSLPSTLKEIGYESFYECYSLTNLVIPAGVETIGNGAFCNCNNLENVSLPSTLKEIGYESFFDCYALRNLVIPVGVETIGNYAFAYCTQLREIVIPASVANLGRYAFYCCSGLKAAYVPRALQSIVESNYVFDECGNVTIYYYDGEEPEFATVTLDWNDGSGYSEGIEAYQVLSDLPMPRKQGYSVEGWYLESGCVNRVDAETAAVDGMTLYANWVETIYEFTHYYENSDGTITLNCGYEEQFDPMVGWYEIRVPCITPRPYGRYEVPSEIDGQAVSSIGDGAFFNCYEMTEIVIPASVTRIESSAFSGCSALANIVVDDENVNYSSRGGMLYDKTGETLIYCPQGKGGNISVPMGTKYIGEQAFQGNSNFDSVSLPDGLLEIMYYAFGYCNNPGFTHVELPSSVRTIGTYAFGWCSYLETVDGLDESTMMEGRGSFAATPFESSRDFSLVIENGAIQYFHGTPPSTLDIGEWLDGASVTEIGYGAFTSWYGASVGTINKVIVPEGVFMLGEGAFAACYDMREITLPDSLTTIGPNAFSGCSSLTDVYIPQNVEYVASSAFNSCSRLQRIYAPETLRGTFSTSYGTIEYYDVDTATVTLAMNDGTGESIEIDMYHRVLANLPTPRRQDWTFTGWFTEDGTQVFDGDDAEDGMVLYAHWTPTVYAFGNYYENDDGTLTLTYGFEYIQEQGYDETVPCVSPRPYGRFEIPSEIDGKAVAVIDDLAFYACGDMTEIHIPASVSRIEKNAFENCSSLTNIVVDEENETYSSRDGMLYDKAGETLIQCPPGRGGAVVVPEGTVEIGEKAFFSNNLITSIELPEGLEVIDPYAFYNAEGLETVVFGDGLVVIDKYAFYSCDRLESIFIPETVEVIEEAAFSSCQNLVVVEGLDDLSSDAYIAPNAFGGTPFERSMPFEVIVDGNAIVGIRGIAPATLNLADYIDVDDVSVIGAHAFSAPWGFDGSRISTLVIPEGIERIERGAFANCEELRDVVLPDTLKSIENGVFYDADSLRRIRLPWNIEYVDYITFESCDNLTVEVPRRLEGKLSLDYVYVEYYDDVIDGDVIYASEDDLPDEPLSAVSGATVTVGVDTEPTEEALASLAGRVAPARGAEGQDPGYFKSVAKYDAASSAVVITVKIDEEAVELSDTVAEIMTPGNMASFAAGAGLELANVVDGFYYGVAVAGTLDDLVADGSAGVSLEKAEGGSLNIQVAKPAGGSAFFRVVISDKP